MSLRHEPLTRLVGRAVEVSIFLLVVLLAIGLALGYRPIILVSGSMTPAAPQGSLVVVSEVPRDEVELQDIIVVRVNEDMLLTHRVVELFERDGSRFAITKGDANATPDAIARELEARQRVVRFVVPALGAIFMPFAGGLALTVVVLALLLGFGLWLRSRLLSAHSPVGRPTDDLVPGRHLQASNLKNEEQPPTGEEIERPVVGTREQR